MYQQYIDYLDRIYKVSSLSNSFDNLVNYYFNNNNIDNIKRIKIKDKSNSLANLVNYIDDITFNDDMLDDYYRNKSKNNLYDLLSRNDSRDKINTLTNICNALNIERHIKLSNRAYNPLKEKTISRTINNIDKFMKHYFSSVYNSYLKKSFFYDSIPYVFVYNYIEDYKIQEDIFKDKMEYCNSPFYVVKVAIELTDDDDRNSNYITIPVLVFPFLNKFLTIMLSFCNKSISEIENYLDIIFISQEYKSTRVDRSMSDIVKESISYFLASNPYYMTNIIKDIYVDRENIYFGNTIYDKVCGYLRSNGSSRHFIITRDEDFFWLDKLFRIEEDAFRDTELYNKVMKYEKKNIKDYNDDYYSWIDSFYNEDGMANINNFFNDLNSLLQTNKKVEPLVSFIKESNSSNKVEED